MFLSWNLSLLKIHFLLGASVTWMWSENKLGCRRHCSYSYYFFHYCKLLWACMIETAIDKHAIIFSLSPWSLAEIRTWCSIFVLDREKQGGVNGGERTSSLAMICKEKKFPSLKEAHTYVNDDTQLSEDLVLKGRLLILFAREKRKHAHSRYLLYHF